MRLNFKEKLKKLVNILFPQDIKCIFCGEEIKTPNKYNICENCLKNLPYNNKKICKHCGVQIFGAGDICYSCFLEFPNFKIARAPFVYTDKIRLAINKFKFDNAKYFFEPLGQFLIDEYDKNGYDCDIIIPVPLSPNRLQNRHFNQAELLEKPLAKQKNIPLKTDIAKRVKNTNAQAYLNSFDRKLNLENAFEIIDKKAIKNKNILVVDDVMTTGETIKSLCREIVKSKPKSISVLTLAHTVFEENK
ncbi:MAG: ComF family protein [Clostridia bacterium]|nr:ComF family protein [Clostridia bacterium]